MTQRILILLLLEDPRELLLQEKKLQSFLHLLVSLESQDILDLVKPE